MNSAAQGSFHCKILILLPCSIYCFSLICLANSVVAMHLETCEIHPNQRATFLHFYVFHLWAIIPMEDEKYGISMARSSAEIGPNRSRILSGRLSRLRSNFHYENSRAHLGKDLKKLYEWLSASHIHTIIPFEEYPKSTISRQRTPYTISQLCGRLAP